MVDEKTDVAAQENSANTEINLEEGLYSPALLEFRRLRDEYAGLSTSASLKKWNIKHAREDISGLRLRRFFSRKETRLQIGEQIAASSAQMADNIAKLEKYNKRMSDLEGQIKLVIDRFAPSEFGVAYVGHGERLLPYPRIADYFISKWVFYRPSMANEWARLGEEIASMSRLKNEIDERATKLVGSAAKEEVPVQERKFLAGPKNTEKGGIPVPTGKRARS